MLTKILVPLDGSTVGDAVLHQVRRLLVRQDAEVLLVRVIPEELVEGNTWVPEHTTENVRRHIERVCQELVDAGARAFFQIRTGEPAATILREAEDFEPSLIVMSSHGRSGIARWLLGSVAERVLRAARHPVLISTAKHNEPDANAELRFGRILVPLDGSELSASILPLVTEFAQAYESSVVLEHVLPDLASIPSAYAAVPAALPSVEDGHAVLAPYVAQLEDAGVPVSARVHIDRVAARLLDTAEEEKVDLIAMTTHGRSGAARWLFGSVAEKVLRHSPVPILALRTGEPEEEASLTEEMADGNG
ncbi:MAG: universal stress protein [Planctomycetota bacterium]|jgi:nucleotide-binding universal stress UspA family protein